MKKNSAKSIACGGITAALYVILTLVSSSLGLSSGVIQLRLSEALCILPCFARCTVPGLFVGCFFANVLTGSSAIDILFGSLATLVGAIGTYFLRNNKYLSLIPPILSNTIAVPLILKYSYNLDGALWYFIITVFIGEVLSVGILGLLLRKAIIKNPRILEKFRENK